MGYVSRSLAKIAFASRYKAKLRILLLKFIDKSDLSSLLGRPGHADEGGTFSPKMQNAQTNPRRMLKEMMRNPRLLALAVPFQ